MSQSDKYTTIFAIFAKLIDTHVLQTKEATWDSNPK